MQNTPVNSYYYSKNEWDRLGCGPLPAERDRSQQPSPIKLTENTVKPSTARPSDK